jgi:hypothetical protein
MSTAAKKPAKAKRPSPKAAAAKRKAATAKRASKAAAKAKAKGAVGPNGSRKQRALRNTAIIARLEGGATSEEVAAEFGIAPRTVRLVRETSDRWPSPLDAEPMAVLEGIAKDYRRAIEDFLAMAHKHEESSPSVAVAALKGALTARERYVELLSAVGKLPENLELFRAESVLRQLADEMVEAMEKVEAGEMSAGDAADLFRQMTTPQARIAA